MEKRLNRPPWRQNLKEKARYAKNDYPSPYLRIVEPLMERLDSWASGRDTNADSLFMGVLKGLEFYKTRAGSQ
jgi:hypothetical protein